MLHPRVPGLPVNRISRTENAMQYTKSMIDHIFLIRKIVPTPTRAQVKLTNPELLDLLANLYQEVEDLLLRDLIRQLMAMAGPAWITRLQGHHENPHQQVYRGHALTTAAPTPMPAKTAAAAKEKTVIYRGHTVVLSS
jgi:hypothetical protein